MKTLFLAMSEAGAPAIEPTIVWLVQWLKLGIETTGALLIAIGVVVAIIQLLRQFAAQDLAEFTAIRLTLARYLALALEFQLGADILSTAVAPSWEQIGKLGGDCRHSHRLEFFLSMEMQSERHSRKAKTGAA